MRHIFYLIFMLFNLICTNSIFAADNTYQFNSAAQQLRFYQLTHQLRCLVCQNETLADSNAPLAMDLRNKIAQQIMAGVSDKDILNYLVNRYGDFILYKPRFISMTYILWCAPLMFLLCGILLWWRTSHYAQINQINTNEGV